MAFINDSAFDAALDWIDSNGTQLNICSAEPSSYANMGTVSLGVKTGISIGSPTDGDTSGRKVVVAAITNGSVTASGTAAYWAISNGTDTLVATGALTASQIVTTGNQFTLEAFNITFPDAV